MRVADQSAMPGIPPTARPPEIPDHELLCLIGRGSYGEVWLARNAIGTLRAVKLVCRQSFQRTEHIERIHGSAQIRADLPFHPAASRRLPPRECACGSFDPLGSHPTDPRTKYRCYFPADLQPA